MLCHGEGSATMHTLLLNAVNDVTNLHPHAVKESTMLAYSSAVRSFCYWLYHSGYRAQEIASLDRVLVIYGDFLFDDNPRRGQRQRLVNTLSGIEFFMSYLRRTLHSARLAVKGWDKLVPSCSPPPANCRLSQRLLPEKKILKVGHRIPTRFTWLFTRGVVVAAASALSVPWRCPLVLHERSTRSGCVIDVAKTGR